MPGPSSSRTARLKDALSVYADWRMAKILLIGFISGFPWVLIGSMITLWLQEAGFSRSGIGLFGLVFTVYAFNMLWAPLVDSIRIPLLTRALGQRRSWIVAMQGIIALAVVSLSRLDPTQDLIAISAWALLIAIASATQDVAIDATRIELIGRMEARKVGAGSAMATSGWWAGYGLGGSLALFSAQALQNRGIEGYWPATYLVTLAVIGVSVAALLRFVEEPPRAERETGQSEDVSRMRELLVATSASGLSARMVRILFGRAAFAATSIAALLLALLVYPYAGASLVSWIGGGTGLGLVALFAVFLTAALILWALLYLLKEVVVRRGGGGADALARGYSIYYMPVARFLKNHGVRVGAIIIATIILFKVGEAFLGRMSLVFYKEIGFSKADIALYQKGLGTISVCIFSVIGSLINARYGLFRGIFLSGVAMASTNLLFALLAAHPVKWLFTCAVVTDQFTTAISTVAFVAFISQLCDRTYTATQYAAFASLGNLSRTTLSAGSGIVVDALGGNWTLFFVITTVMVVPSLLLLLVLRKDLQPLMEGQTTKFI
ncbi:MAG: AmpG family muropeptide MFS transporter [bacterium]|nr:AmpG family muropeptide MFS transporter [bacterium]